MSVASHKGVVFKLWGILNNLLPSAGELSYTINKKPVYNDVYLLLLCCCYYRRKFELFPPLNADIFLDDEINKKKKIITFFLVQNQQVLMSRCYGFLKHHKT